MQLTKPKMTIHPDDTELAGFLEKSLSSKDRARIEGHIASCDECLIKLISAYESVRRSDKERKASIMKKINIYLILAIISFLLSFIMPRYFLQFLVATLLLGIKWIVDAKTTRMLITIYEAWKTGGGKEAQKIFEEMNSRAKNRF